MLVSIAGCAEPLNLSSNVEKSFKAGLVGLVTTTKAWVTTDGRASGATRLCSSALLPIASEATCIGLVPWGAVHEHEEMLLSDMGAVYKYNHGEKESAGVMLLDANHSHYMLVDDEC